MEKAAERDAALRQFLLQTGLIPQLRQGGQLMTDSEESANLPNTLLRVAELAFDNRGRAYGMSSDNREQLAEYLAGLGQFIRQMSNAIRNNEPLCESYQLPESHQETLSPLNEIIGLENFETLMRGLDSARQPNVLASLAQAPEREEYLRSLQEASSLFQAMASYLRAL